MSIYKRVDGWEKLNGALMRFICVENLETGKYVVIRSTVYNYDSFRNIKGYKELSEMDDEAFFEGLFTSVPEDTLRDDEPTNGYDSLKAAIQGWCDGWGM